MLARKTVTPTIERRELMISKGMRLIDEATRSLVESIVVEEGFDPNERIVCKCITGKELKLPKSDYVLTRGPETLLTCRFRNSVGQVFTTIPDNYDGTLREVLGLDLSDPYERSVFYATANAVLKELGYIKNAIHCEKNKPVECGRNLVFDLLGKYGVSARILHIGYQSGHCLFLNMFLKDNSLVTDLKDEIVWTFRHGRQVYDGVDNRIYIGLSDVVLVTASTVVNGSFWDILSQAIILGKDIIVYGISAGAVLWFLERFPFKVWSFCPFSS